MKFDWQWVIVTLLLIGAVYYVFRVIKKSFTQEHNCTDCGVPIPGGDKMKSNHHAK